MKWKLEVEQLPAASSRVWTTHNPTTILAPHSVGGEMFSPRAAPPPMTPRVRGRSEEKIEELLYPFQTPRVWGRSRVCSGHPTQSSFRPHACGEDLPEEPPTMLHIFQTPRLWGGSRAHTSVSCVEFFRPHACGVDKTGFKIVICPDLSDPTRVGWTMFRHQKDITISFQTPRAWGGHFRLSIRFDGLVFRPHARGVDVTNTPYTVRPTIFQTPRVWGRW